MQRSLILRLNLKCLLIGKNTSLKSLKMGSVAFPVFRYYLKRKMLCHLASVQKYHQPFLYSLDYILHLFAFVSMSQIFLVCHRGKNWSTHGFYDINVYVAGHLFFSIDYGLSTKFGNDTLHFQASYSKRYVQFIFKNI